MTHCVVEVFLGDCWEKDYCTNSRSRREGQTHGEITPEAGHASYRKTNRHPNAASQYGARSREHLTEGEVERLIAAGRRNRHGHRDATMILVAYRHGLRVVLWTCGGIGGLPKATLHVRRVKQGTPSTHPLLGDEMRALRRLQREQGPKSPFVFTSERGAPFRTAGFARMLERAGGGGQDQHQGPPALAPARLRLRPGQQGTTPGHRRPTSGIATSSTRCGTPNWRPLGSRISGAVEQLFGLLDNFIVRFSMACLLRDRLRNFRWG